MENKELKALLMDELVEKRLQATRELVLLNGFDQPLFLIALGDEDWRVRKEAINYFMQQPNAISRADIVIDQLSHPDNAGLRNAAIEILIGLGAQIADNLLPRLDSSDAEVRKFIVDILGEISCPWCVNKLLPYLQDKDENVRYAVVETLGKLRSVDAVEGLLKLLETSEPGLQFTIFEALTSIGKGVPAAQILPYAQNALLRKAVFNCLGQLCDVAAIPVLQKGLSDPMRKNREVALLSFGQLVKSLALDGGLSVERETDEVIERLLDYLRHEQLEYRRAACYVLSLFPDAPVVSHILPLLAEEELRADVVCAARNVPKTVFAGLLESTKLNDESALYLIYLLGELGCSEIEPLALEGIQAEDPQFRYASIIALGEIGTEKAIPLLGDALEDDIAELRDAASDALRLIGRKVPREVVQTISPYLESPESELRLLAVRTLGNMPVGNVESFLLLALKDATPAVRCEALRSLAGHNSPRLLSGLSLALTDEVADVRRLAASALGSFPAQKSTSILKHVLEDSDPWVRMEAIRALNLGEETETLAILERGLADPVGLVAIATLETMQRLLPKKSADMLLRSLNHEDPEVVGTAVRLFCVEESCQQLLTHARPLVRLQAVSLLRRADCRDRISLFEECLKKETDVQVRQALEDALRKGVAGG
ncbi:HEAT repeat domain-containing protein [Malonomonas rubra]|uniref:HEAT repeat domain-containing protein n=1 Tax=Malonomonas rubra TaxID=57040 RepID=UPI0026EE58C0|nr:HEAT repeat domain-containing protein [Malonomonas rubra]